MKKHIDLNLAGMVLAVMAIVIGGLVSHHKSYIEMNDPGLCGIYCRMALDYGSLAAAQQFDKYYFSKSFLSFVAWISIRLAGLDPTPLVANYVCEILNGICLLVAAVLWHVICVRQKIATQLQWIGFAGLFFGQMFLNLTSHAQESPDGAALMVGMLGLYFILQRSLKGVLAVLTFTAFIQPQLKVILLPVICMLGYESFAGKGTYAVPVMIERWRAGLQYLLSWLSLTSRRQFTFWFLALSLMFSVLSVLSFFVQPPYFGTSAISVPLLPVSILIQSALIALAFVRLGLVDALATALQTAFYRQFVHRVALCLAIVAATGIFSSVLGRGEILSLNSTSAGRLWFAYTFLQQSIAQPGMALIVHLTFYGPLIALFLIEWKRLATNAIWLGPGFVIACATVIMLSNGIESRHLIAFLPWLTFLLVRNAQPWPNVLLFTFVTLQLVASRFYAPYRQDYTNEWDPYLMIWGPWVSPSHYWDYFWPGLLGLLLMTCACAYDRDQKK